MRNLNVGNDFAFQKEVAHDRDRATTMEKKEQTNGVAKKAPKEKKGAVKKEDNKAAKS